MTAAAETPEEVAVELRTEPRLRYYGASEHHCSEQSWNVLVLRSQGLSYFDIAARLRISYARAHQIVMHHISAELAQWWDDLAAVEK